MILGFVIFDRFLQDVNSSVHATNVIWISSISHNEVET